ncbi:MAG: hypothetical protein ACT4OO_01035 [Nitrospiraceae bacterium]
MRRLVTDGNRSRAYLYGASAVKAGEVALKPIVAALHVHSTASTGSPTVEAVAERAEWLGVNAVLSASQTS